MSNVEMSKVLRLAQFSNIEVIIFTFEVLKDVKSNYSVDEEDLER